MHSPAYAAPQGGQVSAGQATISQQQLTTDIHQSSQNAVINWQKFDIQPNETVNFHQPNAESITLNRVVGNEESAIRGAINANGNVFISNPNGVLIGKEAQINVGSLVATTQNIKDDDLMNNRLNFNGQAGGKVENNANIKVPKGGVIALIAPIVKNSGKLTASEGAVLLASAEQFRITLPKDNFSYTLDRGTLQGLVDNQGAILADGGRVVLTAKGIDAVKKSVIKHSGAIEANTVSNKNGVVELLGDLEHSELQMTGSIKAEGKGTQQGGQVETSAAKLKISEKANVSTKSEKGKTGKWTIDPKDFTVAKSGGDMSGQAVSNALKNNNVELKSRNGAKEGKGDVIINDEISWDKNTLTLNAENDIHINKTLNGSGTAKLALEYGQGSDDGGEADYYLDKNTPLASRTVKVNLPEGKNFTTKKGSEGEVVEYEVIHQMPEIVRNENERNGDRSDFCEASCEQWKSQFTASNIAFGKDIDLSHTANYQGFAGWDVPENGNKNLPVRIEGLGHQVDKLTLTSKKAYQPTGLFTQMHNSLGTIRNIGITNMNISSEGEYAFAGGLVGREGYNITNSYATGRVTTLERASAGGLVGREGYNITNSYASSSVTTSANAASAGGLVGSYGENISNSYVTGSVTTSGDIAGAGGLVGAYGQYISNSYATGSVATSGESAFAGGLVGDWGYNITNSYATGSVTTSGYNAGAGGLVGWNGENITNSYATGSVTTLGRYASAGGLVGDWGYNITNSYATGSVTTSGYSAYAGGLVGDGGKNISNGYATGSVTTLGQYADAGGVLGYQPLYRGEPNITNTYFNMNQVSSEKGEVNSYGAGVSEQALKQKTTFENWDFDTVWRIDEGRDTPRLRALTEGKIVVTPDPEKTEAGITANNLSKTYDGEAVNTEADLAKLDGWNGTGYTVSGLKEGDSTASIFNGGLTFNGAKSTWKGAVNAGEYVLDPTADLTEAAKQKYEIVWNTGTLTINKRPIGLSGSKEYNRNAFAKAADFYIARGVAEKDYALFHNETRKLRPDVLSGTVAIGGSEVSEEGYRLRDTVGLTLKEELAKNYEIIPADSFVSVTPATLKMDLSLHGRRQYDGTKDALVDENTVLEGKIGSDDVSLVKGGKGILKSENAGKQPLVDLGTIALTGSKAKNYKLTTEGSYWDITKKPLRVIGRREYEPKNERGDLYDYDSDLFSYYKFYKPDLLTGYDIIVNKDDIPLSKRLTKTVKIKKDFDGILSGSDIGEHKLLNFKELTLEGEDKDNYILTEVGSRFEVIPTKLKLFVPGIREPLREAVSNEQDIAIYRVVADKVYDGKTTMGNISKPIRWSLRRAGARPMTAQNDHYGYSEFDGVSVAFDATFSQSDVGNNIPVTISNIRLTGEEAKKFYIDPKDPFHIDFKNSLVADITPLEIYLTANIEDGIEGTNRTFAQLNDIINRDMFRLTYQNTFKVNKFLNHDWPKGKLSVNRIGDREYAIQIGTLKSPNNNYVIKYNDRHIFITDRYDVSEYDSAIVGLAARFDQEELTRKNESPGIDYVGIVSDVTSAPLAIAKHQFEAVSSYFDDTSRKWVSNFIREIESMNISVNIDGSNSNAIINAVDEEFKEFNSIAQYNTAYTLLIKGLREAKSAVDVPLKIHDVVEKVSIIASIPDFVENAKELVSDLIDNSKERENLKKVISSLRKNPGDRTAFGKLKYSLGNKWGKELAISYATDANSIHTALSELSKIISIIEFEKKQNEVMNFLGRTTSLEGIAKLVIQQKILGDLISKGQISPSELSRMRLYDVKNNSLYIK